MCGKTSNPWLLPLAVAALAMLVSIAVDHGCARADQQIPSTPPAIVSSQSPAQSLERRLIPIEGLQYKRIADDLLPGRNFDAWATGQFYLDGFNTLGVPFGGIKLTLEGDKAKEYGTTAPIEFSTRGFGSDKGYPEGVAGMFGYTNKEGIRHSSFGTPLWNFDIAEASIGGQKQYLIAVVSAIHGAFRDTANISPYDKVDLTALQILRLPQSTDGSQPKFERVLTYVHPGIIKNVHFHELAGDIVCLFAGEDSHVGEKEFWQYTAAHRSPPSFSRTAPSVGYVSCFPKGPTLFADAELADLTIQPGGGIRIGPDGASAPYADVPEGAFFGYYMDGRQHPFTAVDLTQWRGSTAYGHKIRPVTKDLPGIPDTFATGIIREVHDAILSKNGKVKVTTDKRFSVSSPIHWELDTVTLEYRLDPKTGRWLD